MKKLVAIFLGLTCLTAVAKDSGSNDKTVNVYSFRQSFLIEPLLQQFTDQTGIKTKVVFAKSGLIERIKREGKYSPADVVLTSNFSKLLQLKDEGLTQSFQSAEIDQSVPAHFRDENGHWVALTKRVRNIYASKAKIANPSNLTYEDLGSADFDGKICTRSGKHPYNIGLISSFIAHKGEAATEQWLRGVKANLARKPQGNDRAQVKAIKEGLCDVSLGNSYYFGKMLTNEDQKPWAEAVNIVFPNQNDRGVNINVSGAVVAKFAPHSENAKLLIAFLASEKAQQAYASLNMEYPVNPNVEPSELVASWGKFKEDTLPLTQIAQYRQAALRLVDKVKFDL
ncbi:extracellular solute-binding protein [Psychrosphaera sp. B3R10]|uniref:extracellular solute-binding protein n=1 Tax=unclassified Psychrosphaera TaxID=2641570 RepID=UPI001C0A54CB|nr:MULTISPECIES: extracellular solute-binding protein [unclassified Psychrosphaera]MBU2881027.1 extracellular solute-binding protein [Psychrosphaera sp. I2R16]MBU2989951.1 extracellular solute-binding protein [Psychrosphaera sp. B3R10]MDO6719158.1 extracellular solute-binding protein [Psychrosphaera sp. 1_MG-2023]